jgi:hypothetical protein
MITIVGRVNEVKRRLPDTRRSLRRPVPYYQALLPIYIIPTTDVMGDTTQATQVSLPAEAPHIGGGVDKDTYWVSSSNLKADRRIRPKMLNAHRPMDLLQEYTIC